MVLEDFDVYYMMNWFEGMGGFDIILPFLLIFSITFAVLKKMDLFGDNKQVNVIVSVVMGIFLVAQRTVVETIQQFLPRVSMIILVLLMLLLVAGIFGAGSAWQGAALTIAAIVGVLAVLWALGASYGWNVPLVEEFTRRDVATLIVVGIFVLVIWLIVRDKDDGQAEGLMEILDKIGNQIKKS